MLTGKKYEELGFADGISRLFQNTVHVTGPDDEREQEYINLEEMLEIAKEEGLQEGQEQLENERRRADAEAARADTAESELERLREELARVKAGLPAKEE